MHESRESAYYKIIEDRLQNPHSSKVLDLSA